MNLTGVTRYNFERKEQNVDRKSVLTNLKSHDGLWGSKNYPLNQEEAEVIIEALEEKEPYRVKPILEIPQNNEFTIGGQCKCLQLVVNTDKFCRNCGKPLDWGTDERVQA